MLIKAPPLIRHLSIATTKELFLSLIYRLKEVITYLYSVSKVTRKIQELEYDN